MATIDALRPESLLIGKFRIFVSLTPQKTSTSSCDDMFNLMYLALPWSIMVCHGPFQITNERSNLLVDGMEIS